MGMAKEVQAMRVREGGQGRGESIEKTLESALSGMAERDFQFREGQFDGVKIGAVGREVEQGGASRLDDVLDAFDFVSGEIVTDDDVAGREFGAEDFAQIGQEGGTVHRAIQQPRSGQPVMTQRGDEGGALPMAVRHGTQAALPAFTAPIQTAHLGVEPGFIQEDEAAVVPGSALILPTQTGGLNIRTILLGGAQRFF